MNSQRWGGALEINPAASEESMTELEQQQHERYLTQQSWLLGPPEKKQKKYVDFGCIVCSTSALKWTVYGLLIAVCVIGLPIMIGKLIPKHKVVAPVPDNYTVALRQPLLFFDAQKSGRLPKNNRVPWRGNSGLQDGSGLTKLGLVGGYYDGGGNTKYHFPMSFGMTMLSWSLLEYEHKYKAIGEYDHTRELIKWGTDYLLLTFNSNATKIDKIYTQVGGIRNGSTTPDDGFCWERPEDMDYPRQVQSDGSAPDLGAETAAALASASIVFRDDTEYSKKLVKGATTVFRFAMEKNMTTYSKGNPTIEPFYNSTGFSDELLWGSTWMFYATGNKTYLKMATNPQGFAKQANVTSMKPDLSVPSWDNKLPAAMLLLTRFRMVLNPGYPCEEMLMSYHNLTGLNMCSYLQTYNVFNWTRGGLIQLNHGRTKPLQYVANAAFLASVFADYMDVMEVPGWYCGPDFVNLETLRHFATSQINYILGANPQDMSYVVGFGSDYPKHVHHRGASIPHDGKKRTCTGGFRWRDSPDPNPNIVKGAMVGGPDKFDKFKDNRANSSYTEPSIAGNAGLVSALVSLTKTVGVAGADRNAVFSAIPPLYTPNPPPPPPWKP